MIEGKENIDRIKKEIHSFFDKLNLALSDMILDLEERGLDESEVSLIMSNALSHLVSEMCISNLNLDTQKDEALGRLNEMFQTFKMCLEINYLHRYSVN